MSVVATASVRAQDVTVRSTRPFSAGAAFTGFFSSESDHGTGAMLGGFGYTAISRLLLGGQGGAVGLGSGEPGGYGLVDIGYVLHTRPNRQIYILCGFGGGKRSR